MPTIDSKEFIDELIEKKGKYEDDPPIILICQYTNDWGNIAYHISYSPREIEALITSPHCHQIKVLWQSDDVNIVII